MTLNALVSFEDINPCDDGVEYCLNGGTCTFGGFSANCDCPLGYTGDHCESGSQISTSNEITWICGQCWVKLGDI